ncbi:unnamed protein product [Mytilus coruscus]|uniref:Uncharacterized protein n=1 Tax=Mytilus coruscus TaxID=42192 RepID=A0A6J8DRU2_MYTCO|nr:unnamed protein product [Mytilus coruscus]
MMFREIIVSVLVGSICAQFWDRDSDNYGDSFVRKYRDYRDSDSNGLYDDYNNNNDDDSDESYRNRFLVGGFRRRQSWRQRAVGLQPRRQQTFSRFNTARRRSQNRNFRNSRRSSRVQSQRRPSFNVQQRTLRNSARNRFQTNRNFFGGNSPTQAAMLYNAFDMDFF